MLSYRGSVHLEGVFIWGVISSNGFRDFYSKKIRNPYANFFITTNSLKLLIETPGKIERSRAENNL